MLTSSYPSLGVALTVTVVPLVALLTLALKVPLETLAVVIVYSIALNVAPTVTSLAGIVKVFPLIAVPFTVMLTSSYPSLGVALTVTVSPCFAEETSVEIVPLETLSFFTS